MSKPDDAEPHVFKNPALEYAASLFPDKEGSDYKYLVTRDKEGVEAATKELEQSATNAPPTS